VQLPDVPFSEAIRFFEDVSGNEIFVKWNALQAAGIDKTTRLSTDTIDLQKVKFSNALDLLLFDVGDYKLGYIVKTDTVHLHHGQPKLEIVISTIEDLKATAKASTMPS
jgi:hypothetical protein